MGYTGWSWLDDKIDNARYNWNEIKGEVVTKIAKVAPKGMVEEEIKERIEKAEFLYFDSAQMLARSIRKAIKDNPERSEEGVESIVKGSWVCGKISDLIDCVKGTIMDYDDDERTVFFGDLCEKMLGKENARNFKNFMADLSQTERKQFQEVLFSSFTRALRYDNVKSVNLLNHKEEVGANFLNAFLQTGYSEDLIADTLAAKTRLNRKQAGDVVKILKRKLLESDKFDKTVEHILSGRDASKEISGLLADIGDKLDKKEYKTVLDAVATLYPEAKEPLNFLGNLKNGPEILNSALQLMVNNPNTIEALRNIGNLDKLKNLKGKVPTGKEVAGLLRTMNEKMTKEERNQLFKMIAEMNMPDEVKIAIKTISEKEQKQFIEMLAEVIGKNKGEISESGNYPKEFVKAFSKQDFAKSLIATLIQKKSRGILNAKNAMEVIDVMSDQKHDKSFEGFLSALLLDKKGNFALNEDKMKEIFSVAFEVKSRDFKRFQEDVREIQEKGKKFLNKFKVGEMRNSDSNSKRHPKTLVASAISK